MTPEQVEAILESNAKAIASNSEVIAELRRDRNFMYSSLRDLTDKISTLVSAQAQSYELMQNLDNRQQQLTDQQRQLSNQQQQLINIIKSLSEKN